MNDATRVHIPGLLTYCRHGDLVHLAMFGKCVYVRAGHRRRLLGLVWGTN